MKSFVDLVTQKDLTRWILMLIYYAFNVFHSLRLVYVKTALIRIYRIFTFFEMSEVDQVNALHVLM